MQGSQFRLFGTRRFTPLFLVQFLGAFNDQLFKNAMIALLTYSLAAKMGMSDATLTGHLTTAAALFILPFALVAPTAGQIADRVDKARMMRWIKFTEIILMLLGAIAFAQESLTALYVLVFLMGAQSAVFSPIKYGVLPQYLSEKELVAGNGLVQGATFLAILLGQIIGAKLILADAGVWLVSGLAVTMAVIGWVAALNAPPAPPLAEPEGPVDWFLPRAIWRIIADARRHRRPFGAILGIAWFWFVGAVFLTLLPAYAKSALKANEDVFILLLSAFSVGVAIGSLLCNRVFRGEVKIGAAPWGAIGIAVFSVLLWVASSAYAAPGEELIGVGVFMTIPAAWGVLAALVALAACCGLYLTPLNVIMQATAPPEKRGRIVAASNVIDAAAMVFSSVVAMVLTGAGLTTPMIYMVIGGTGILAALFVARGAPETLLGRAGLRLWPARPV